MEAALARLLWEQRWLAQNYYPAVFRPMPKQERFIRSRTKINVLSGGNRSGKTEAGAIRAALIANNAMHLFYPEWPEVTQPTRGWVVALDYKLAEVCKKKLLGDGRHPGALGRTLKRWRERDQMIELVNGSTIWIKSEESGSQKFQADDIDWAWKDECGDLRSEGVFEELLRGLADRNGPLWITMTPTLGSSWIGPRLYEPWVDATGGEEAPHRGVLFQFMDTRHNVYMSRAGLEDFVSRQTTANLQAMRLRGEFISLEGLVFPTFDQRRHIIPSFPVPREWPRWRGMDFGLSSPSTCIWIAVEPAPARADEPCDHCHQTHGRARIHVYRELYHKAPGRTVRETCELVKGLSGDEEYVQTVLDPKCWKKDPAPDAVGGYFVVAHEYEKWGIYAQPANNETEPSVVKILELLGTDEVEPQLVIHDCVTELPRELRRLSWKKGMGGMGSGMEDRIDKGSPDHAIDGLRYALMCDPLGGGSPFAAPTHDPWQPEGANPYGLKMIERADGSLGVRLGLVDEGQ